MIKQLIKDDAISFITGFINEYGLWPDVIEYADLESINLEDLGLTVPDQASDYDDFDD